MAGVCTLYLPILVGKQLLTRSSVRLHLRHRAPLTTLSPEQYQAAHPNAIVPGRTDTWSAMDLTAKVLAKAAFRFTALEGRFAQFFGGFNLGRRAQSRTVDLLPVKQAL